MQPGAASRSFAPIEPRNRRDGGPGLRRTARGFSLLEVLVAFVILSLVATALFGLLSGALGNASAADDYSRAVAVAESVLTEAAAAQPLRETTQTGTADDGRITWNTKVAAYSPPGGSPELERAAESLSVELYRITAEVAFAAPSGGQRTFALATTRLVPRNLVPRNLAPRNMK